jgi:predicted protein tyrosine phosphatase
MEKLLAKMYEITMVMKQALDEEKYQEVEKLLDDRSRIIAEIDSVKNDQEFQYSANAIALLKKIYVMDQQVKEKISENFAATQSRLKQIKVIKQVSKKFMPYSQQVSGIFLDAKK